MLDELFKRFDGAYAENTLRAYRSDMMDFMEWCDHNDLQFDNLLVSAKESAPIYRAQAFAD